MKSLLESYEKAWRQKEGNGGFAAGSRQWEALRALPSGGALLDLGCGDGRFLLEAGSRFAEAVGLEGSSEAAERAIRRGLRVIVADLMQIPVPLESGLFDCVTCLDVIEHIPDPRPLIAECMRLLRPGGTLVMTTPNIRYLKRIAALVFEGRFPKTSQDPEPYDGGHFHFFTSKDLCALLSSTGFRVMRRQGILPSQRLAWLRNISKAWAVREFLSDGLLVVAQKGR